MGRGAGGNLINFTTTAAVKNFTHAKGIIKQFSRALFPASESSTRSTIISKLSNLIKSAVNLINSDARLRIYWRWFSNG